MRIATQEMYSKNNNLYRINEEKLQKSIERLSTGIRINKAADDSAGLNISERFETKVNGLKVVKDNLSHATNMLQSAESGLSKIGDMLQRVRELTVQAQNGTYTSEQKMSLQNEVGQILNEINHISKTTRYNNINLLERDGGIKLGPSPLQNVIKIPGASFIPTTATQPRTYDMLVQVDGLNFNTINNMARLFHTQTGYLSIHSTSGEIWLRPDGPGAKSFGVKMPIGEKTRVSVVYDGTQASLFLNGEKKSTISIVGMTSTSSFSLGDRSGPDGISEGIVGTFYEASYYNRALTSEEITSNFDGRNAPQAEAYWDFEETSGSEVIDASGNGNNGAFYGNAVRTDGAVNIHTGYSSSDSMNVSLASVNVNDLNLSSLDITDIKALEKIDHSIEFLNNKRINIGSQINRLNYSQENVETGIQNHSESMSKIKSLDFASESSILVKSEIMKQSISSMFNKAKEYYQSSLNLLQG